MKSVRSSLATSALILASTAASGIISARALGPEGRGMLAAIVLWPTALAGLGSLGILDATSFFSANGQIQRRTVIGSAAAVLAGLSVILTAIGIPLIAIVLSRYGVEAVHLGRYALILVPAFLFGTALGVSVLGTGRVALFNALRSLQPLALAAGAIILYIAGATTIPMFLGITIAAYLINLAAALIVCLAVVGAAWRVEPGTVRDMLRYGARSHVGYVSSSLNVQLGQMVMSMFLAPAALGLYAVGYSLASAMLFIPGALVASSFPDMASHQSGNKMELLGRTVRMTALLCGAIALLLVPAAPLAIRIVFGEAFLPAVPIMQVLVLATLLLAVNTVLAVGLRALNQPMLASRAEIVSLACTAVALAVFLPALGPIGAALSLLVAQLVMALYLLRQLKRGFGFHARALVLPQRSDWDWVTTQLRA
jgi:O-antigen/teichoic acid export membrane protein